jgi:hypothetical protein
MTRPYLPVQCSTCGKVQLVACEAGQVPSCRGCSAPTAFLPGESYGETDVALFDRIEDAIRPLPLSRRTAERVVTELRDVALRTEAPEAILLRIVDFLPSLHFLIPALYLQPSMALERSMLARATGMVRTIVSTRLRELESRAS